MYGNLYFTSAWFDVTRRDAERMLLWPAIADGTFLVRPASGENQGTLILQTCKHSFSEGRFTFHQLIC